MDNKEQGNNKILDNELNMDSNIKKIITDNVEITLNIRKQKNPAELLKSLYLLRNNADLSNQQKNEEMRKIMTDYMR